MGEKRFSKYSAFVCALILYNVIGLVSPLPSVAKEEKNSSPGIYSGYATALYDGYELTSRYVTVRDGTNLAMDIIRPTLNGKVTDTPYPVVWMHTPYNRRYFRRDLTAQFYPGAALGLVKYGYVVAVVDMRGMFGSYGSTYEGDNWDGYDITEWLAKQPWCDGTVGMWGCSATGGSQIAAANLMPPSLKAIFPLSCGFSHKRGVSLPPKTPLSPSADDTPGDIPAADAFAVPVDGDTEGEMLKAVKEDHRFNYLGRKRTPISLDQLEKSGIAMYNAANWIDIMPFPRDTFLRSFNLGNPSKILMGPGAHCLWCTEFSPKPFPLDFDILAEEHRFFDYWLKGIENGVMDEPPVYFFTYNTPAPEAWRFAWQWPLPDVKPTKFYLGPGPSGEGYGVNDGILSTEMPPEEGTDIYTTDYDIHTENVTDDQGLRWITQPLASKRGLTYITDPLAADLEVTGHPEVHLWISSTAKDGDFMVDVEDISPDGEAESIIKASGSPSFGIIAAGRPLPDGINGFRASNRATQKAPFNNFGLPWHTNLKADEQPLIPGQPAELAFDLRPVSYVFKAGHRIRMSITAVCGDATPKLSPAPVVTFHRNAIHGSYITLPVIEQVAVTVNVTDNTSQMIASITFPATLDHHYIQDINTGSIICNGVSPESTVFKGETLVAVFSKKNMGKVKVLEIRGTFGRNFKYGNMAFSGTGVVP